MGHGINLCFHFMRQALKFVFNKKVIILANFFIYFKFNLSGDKGRPSKKLKFSSKVQDDIYNIDLIHFRIYV